MKTFIFFKKDQTDIFIQTGHSIDEIKQIVVELQKGDYSVKRWVDFANEFNDLMIKFNHEFRVPVDYDFTHKKVRVYFGENTYNHKRALGFYTEIEDVKCDYFLYKNMNELRNYRMIFRYLFKELGKAKNMQIEKTNTII